MIVDKMVEQRDCYFMETFKEDRGDYRVTVAVFSDGELAHMYFKEKKRVTVELVPLEYYEDYKNVLLMEHESRNAFLEYFFKEVLEKDKRFVVIEIPKQAWKYTIKPRARKGLKIQACVGLVATDTEDLDIEDLY